MLNLVRGGCAGLGWEAESIGASPQTGLGHFEGRFARGGERG
jgi:hypothetical protein